MERKAVVWVRRGLWATIAGVFIYAAYLSRAQFLMWHADVEGAALLLPPYHGMGYFVRYAFVHFWLEYVIALFVAAIFFTGARWLNTRHSGMLFEDEEPYFLAISLFVVGHPAWIFYLCFVFTAYLLVTLIGALIYGAQARISFYYFWLPSVAVAVFLSVYLREYAWYAKLLI